MFGLRRSSGQRFASRKGGRIWGEGKGPMLRESLGVEKAKDARSCSFTHSFIHNMFTADQ